ncbi:3-oxoacyl-ACP synthase [Streptomyces sp. NE5-10]|uniref:3-oxoacyl-ACP synthase III family protein n=1 Tax=Streptomyces sp. NE5-10 TaxID=2759674 RepID=UPI001902C5CB|nr:ketoacyl-ACP synthase III family protein [Streptomyces sp. NE5-10]GHJ96593.1 3-oxoacyl-ACP synthase [Streptomyces sp. NE5-10]
MTERTTRARTRGGIVDFEVVFPSSEVDVRELHESSGVPVADILAVTHTERFPALDEDEAAWELAATAGRTVLERNGIDPDDIGLVLYAGSGEWDLPFWSPAAKVADELGITRAHCFEVANFCNGGMTAVRTALAELALGGAPYALVLIGDRLSRLVDHEDPESKALFNFGDAPAALLLGREDCLLDVVASAARTDPSWADYYSGDVEDDRVLMRRRGRRQGLGDAYLENFPARVDDVLGALGRRIEDVAWFLVNQGDKGMHEKLLARLGIPADKSVFNYHRYGHMGGSDPFIALGDLIGEERLRPGDLVLVAASGMGFSWSVTALEYRGR